MRVALVCLGLLTTWDAQAEDTYEWKRTQQLLEESDLQLAPQPEGKRIAWVRVVRDNIFAEDELWPTWLNWFHKLTKDRVVRRELLFEPGEAYEDARIEETMRNLRSMGIFTLVRIVPVQTEDPDAVGVVVHTRDVWSLRLEADGSLDFSVNRLHLVMVERNLAGLNNQLSAAFTMVPDKFSLSEAYEARRFLGSSVRVAQQQGLILGRLRPGVEGSFGALSVSEPFYRLAQRVSWSIGGSYDARISRQLNAAGQPTQWTADDGRTADVVYDDRSGSASALGAYRFGEEVKMTLGGGFAYSERRTEPNGETDLPDGLQAEFRREVLPLSRRDLGPRLYYDLFLARYRTLTNLDTYGSSENVRVGPRAYLGLYVPIAAFGSTADALVVTGLVEATAAGEDSLFNVSLQATSRLQGNRLIDRRFLGQLRFATPAFGPVRLVSRLAADLRADDSQRTLVSLGSNRGLRGYRARTFTGRGESRVLANLELRSLPWRLGSLHLGGVLFYDVGSVFSNLRHAGLHHAVGVGLRFVFPQFNRYPFSYDVGVPVDPGRRLEPSMIVPVLNTAQSVPITNLADDSFP